MAKSKKPGRSHSITGRQKDFTVTGDNIRASTKVEEPEVLYGNVSASRAFVFLDMERQKEFSGPAIAENFIAAIRKGVTKRSIHKLMEVTGITPTEMASIIRLSDRTLRRYKSQTLLNPEQSEKVVELARLYSRGEEAFGNLENFKEWMNSTVMALGNKKPKEFLDTSLGIDILMDELGRIEHGIFA